MALQYMCKNGVSSNSSLCITCRNWKLYKTSPSSDCKSCKAPTIDEKGNNSNLDTGNGVSLLGKFCYQGDVVETDGRCDSAVTARDGATWRKLSATTRDDSAQLWRYKYSDSCNTPQHENRAV